MKQDKLDTLRRQQLIIDMLGCILKNQIRGLPSIPEALERQKDLVTNSMTESGQMGQEIERVLKDPMC